MNQVNCPVCGMRCVKSGKTSAGSQCWLCKPMPPKVEDSRDVVFLDGIYLGRKACLLICCDEKNVLGYIIKKRLLFYAGAVLMCKREAL